MSTPGSVTAERLHGNQTVPEIPPTPVADESPSAPDIVVSQRPPVFAHAFAHQSSEATMVTTPLRFQPWVPEKVRRDVMAGYGAGTHITVYDDPEGPNIVVWSHEDGDLREVDMMRYAPEDPAVYLRHTRGDQDAARRLLDVAKTHNRDIHHLVEELGLRPYEARTFNREVDQSIFRLFLEAVALTFATPAGVGREPLTHTASRRARDTAVLLRRHTVVGAAEGPSYEFRPNGNGPRTAEEAKRLAQSHGIEFPEDVELYFVEGKHAENIPEGAYASYFHRTRMSTDERLTWKALQNRFGKIPVRVRKEVLESDEATVAVLAHEAYELQHLKKIFEKHESMNALQFRRLVNERRRGGMSGNLHEQAWDEANRMIEKMRGEP